MRRLTLWLLSTLSALVLLLSYPTSIPARVQTAQVATAGGPTGAGGPGTDGPPAASGAPAPTSPRTLTGDTVQTPYGPVQVQVTVQESQVTDVQLLQLPWGNGRDQQINSYAAPVLVDETTSADSAHIDMVSGATYTSRAYIDSLQSALDQL